MFIMIVSKFNMDGMHQFLILQNITKRELFYKIKEILYELKVKISLWKKNIK